jgi:protein-tyrosine-phosphatase
MQQVGAKWLKAFFNSYAPRDYCAISAGTRPACQVNRIAVEAMKEAGIEISKNKSKIITEDMIRSSKKAVNMDCMDQSECPILFIHDVVDWGIEDPKGKPIEKVRQLRDEIEKRVREIAASL